MSKFEVGQSVTVVCKVIAVHPQGFPLGKYPNGRPRLPEGHEKMTPEEIAPFETEQPDVVILEVPDAYEAASHGQLHFKAPA